ncbi:MAG: type II toxin-antitoxin system PemK/MazF family toxin [Cloacibacillus sp.]
MVEQGDLLWLEFDPQAGHEQAGHRPAVVVSNSFFNRATRMAVVCPVTNNLKQFPLHVPLDSRTKTTGAIECEHIKSLDIEARNYKFIERLPKDILNRVIEIVLSEIDEA